MSNQPGPGTWSADKLGRIGAPDELEVASARDVQEAASHADPRTTMRYDRARVSRDRHATYIIAGFLAGADR